MRLDLAVHVSDAMRPRLPVVLRLRICLPRDGNARVLLTMRRGSCLAASGTILRVSALNKSG